MHISKISSTAPLVINCFLVPSETITERRLREKSKGISSTSLYLSVYSVIPFCNPLVTTASSILPLKPV